MQAFALAQPRLRAPRGGLLVGDRQYRGGVFLPESVRPALEVVASKAAVVAQVEPVEIGILGFSYRIRPVPIAASVGTVAYLVIPNHNAESYHVHRSNDGEVVCTCADFTFRRQGTGEPCKHARRLAELGLIASTTPRVLPPFAERTARPVPRVAQSQSYRTRFEPTSDEVRETARLLGWA